MDRILARSILVRFILTGGGAAALLATAACGSTADTTNPVTTTGADAGTGGGGDGDASTAHSDAGGSGGGGGSSDGVIAVPLNACVPLVYSADVAIGGQDFQLIVDTGSTSLGVAGSKCTNCKVTPLYTPTTGVDQSKKATSQFGSGSWTGEIYQDAVSLAPSPKVPLKFASITTQTGFFQTGSTCAGKPYQGLAGMGRANAAVAGTEGFFDQLVATASIPDVFATELCDDGGTLWLGGYDANATSGPVQYTPFTKDAFSTVYYSVALNTVTVGGVDVAIASGAYQDSIVDTGTSAFLVGTTAYNALAAAISADAGFKSVFGAQAASWFTASQGTACANLSQSKAELDAKLPKMTMSFGNPAIKVEAVATESYLMPYTGAGWCNALVGQAQSQNAFPLASIMGAPILRSSVVIIDRAKGQVGFAPHKGCTAAKTTANALVAPTPANLKPRLRFDTSP